MSFKKKTVDLYLKKGIGYKNVERKMEINASLVRRWVRHFKAERVKDLEEKRGKAKGPGIGRSRTHPEDPEVKLKRLEAETETLKKLLQM